jgi:hypothetical protein
MALMSEVVNLADPEFEPTDEQLIQLSVRAFAGVRAAHEAAMMKLRAEIEHERRAIMRWVQERMTDPPDET